MPNTSKSQAICPNFEALSPQQYKRSFNIEFKIKERLATFAEEGICLFVEKSCAREYWKINSSYITFFSLSLKFNLEMKLH